MSHSNRATLNRSAAPPTAQQGVYRSAAPPQADGVPPTQQLPPAQNAAPRPPRERKILQFVDPDTKEVVKLPGAEEAALREGSAPETVESSAAPSRVESPTLPTLDAAESAKTEVRCLFRGSSLLVFSG